MQVQLEKQLSQSQDLSGQLLYFYTQYQINDDTHHREEAEATLVELSAQIVAEKNPDLRTLRGLLLSGVCQDTAVASACWHELTILDEYLADQALDWIAKGTLAGWYAAAVAGYHFILQKMPVRLHALVSTWRSTAEMLASRRGISPLLPYEEQTPLGFEGISGLLLLLIRIEQASHEDMLEKIIREGIRFVLSFRNEVDFSRQQYAVFPQAIASGNGLSEEPRCLAWGGSDLAQALLFYRAYGLFQDVELKRIADLVGLNTLLRKERSHLLTPDETVYGGAAGVAQTYAALYHLSGHQAYHKGYQQWLREILTSLDTPLSDAYPGNEYGLYDGLLGIYLVLLSYRMVPPATWPRVLLLE